jgi:hypothetical protein
MPQNLVDGSAEQASFVPLPPEALAFTGSLEERIAWAKDIIAGRTQPPPMAPTRLVQEFMDREFKKFPLPPPTPEAVRRIIDEGNLQEFYGGDIVLIFTMKAGYRVVLAVGDEVWALFAHLSDLEKSKVLVDYPPIG